MQKYIYYWRGIMPPYPNYKEFVNRWVELYRWMEEEHANPINNLVNFIFQAENQSFPKKRLSGC
jgi:hypothetical protein